MSSLLNKARQSTLFVIPAQVVTRIIGFLYVILLARGLSVESYGIYNFFIGSILVFSYFCNFGLASSLQRFLPEYSKLSQTSRVVKTIIFSHIFRSALSLIAFIVAAYWFQSWAGTFNVSDNYKEFVLFSVGTILFFQIEYFQTEYNALFMHWATSIGRVVYSLLKLLLVYIVLSSGLELSGIFAAEAAAYLVGLLLFLYIFISRIYLRYPRSLEGDDSDIEFKRIGRYSGINALVIPGSVLYSHSMDYFVVAAMANPFQLGIYALASRASKMLMSVLPQSMLQGVIRPAFYHRYYSKEDKNAELMTLFHSLVKFSAAFLFPAIVLFSATAGPLVSLVFGDKYEGAIDVLLVFMFFNISPYWKCQAISSCRQ